MGDWEPSKAKRSIYYTCVGGEADALEVEAIRSRHKRQTCGEPNSEQRQAVEVEILQRRDRLRHALAEAAGLPEGQVLPEGAYERFEMGVDQVAVSNKPASDVSEQVSDLREIAEGTMQLEDVDPRVYDLVERKWRRDPHLDVRAAAQAAVLLLKKIFSKKQIDDPRRRRGRIQEDQLPRLIFHVSEALRLSGIEPRAYHSGRVKAYKGALVNVLAILHREYTQTLGPYDLQRLFERAKQFMDERRAGPTGGEPVQGMVDASPL